MFILTSVLPFVGILVALVIIHEFGHFMVAKKAGVRVEEFGIGMPPRIWGKRFGETLYSINALPLGGFVRLTGEESSRVYIGHVTPHGPADLAGLKVGDVITEVAGEPVHTEEQLAAHLSQSSDDPYIALKIEREETRDSGTEMVTSTITLERVPSVDAVPDDEHRNAGDEIRGATSHREPTSPTPPQPPPPKSEDAATITAIAAIQVRPDDRSLATKSRPVRILVMAAGAGMNAILPFILFAIAAMIPTDTAAGPAVITSVLDGAPADEAGLLAGDRFISIGGTETLNSIDVSREIQLALGNDIDIVVERDVIVDGATQRTTADTEIFETTVHARLAPQPREHTVEPGETVNDVAALLGVSASQVLFAAGLGGGVDLPDGITLTLPDGQTYLTLPDDTAVGVARDLGVRTTTILKAADIDLVNLDPGTFIAVPQGATGITIANGTFGTVKRSSGFFSAWEDGADRTIDTLILLRNRIRSWVAGGEALELSGPVGIAQTTGEVVEQAGWLRLIELAALLSINLAIINILPLPMLDGGRIFFVFLEILRRGKRISPEKEGLVHLTGFALLITFVVVISYFDIARVISGESALR